MSSEKVDLGRKLDIWYALRDSEIPGISCHYCNGDFEVYIDWILVCKFDSIRTDVIQSDYGGTVNYFHGMEFKIDKLIDESNKRRKKELDDKKLKELEVSKIIASI